MLSNLPFTIPAARAPRKLSRDTVFLIGDLLPLLDFVGVLLAAYLGTLAYAVWITPDAAPAGLLDSGARAALAAAVLAPLILCDRAFVSFASGGQTRALMRCYATRFLMFAGAVAAIGLASRRLAALPGTWLALWLAGTLLVTALSRVLLVATLRRLERNGTLAETVAVVGAGARADALIRELRRVRGDGIEILGVFDDTRGPRGAAAPDGSITDLLELGKTRPIDWIVLAETMRHEAPLRALVHRLKALAVPIGLWSADAAEALAQAPARGNSRWSTLLEAAEVVVPRWLLTLAGLPLAVLRHLPGALRAATRRTAPARVTCTLDACDLPAFTAIAARFGQARFGYVVTPNADHLIRLHDDASFQALYAGAAHVLLDSRFVSHLLRFTRELRLPVCAGSDLTAALLGDVVTPTDRIVLIGGSAAHAAQLARRYDLRALAHFNPPMDFINDPAAVEACLRFVEAHSPFRYCLLAVGSPQQEMLAQRLQARGVARGLALCIGGSIAFLTGEERRAPVWLQRCGMEWLFRLLLAPGRMAGRYLVRGPRLFALLPRTRFLSRAPVLAPAPAAPRPPAAPRSPAAGRARMRALVSGNVRRPTHGNPGTHPR